MRPTKTDENHSQVLQKVVFNYEDFLAAIYTSGTSSTKLIQFKKIKFRVAIKKSLKGFYFNPPKSPYGYTVKRLFEKTCGHFYFEVGIFIIIGSKVIIHLLLAEFPSFIKCGHGHHS